MKKNHSFIQRNLSKNPTRCVFKVDENNHFREQIQSHTENLFSQIIHCSSQMNFNDDGLLSPLSIQSNWKRPDFNPMHMKLELILFAFPHILMDASNKFSLKASSCKMRFVKKTRYCSNQIGKLN